jgi:hypothetical protein
MKLGAPVVPQATVAALGMPFLRESVNAVRSGAKAFIETAKVGNCHTFSGEA